MLNIQFWRDLFNLAGPNVRKHFYLSLIIGIFLFGLETISIIVLQGFLVGLGILSKAQALIPGWYPTDITNVSMCLIGLGVFRAIVIYFRNYSKVVSGNIFLKEQRSKLFHYGMCFANVESTHSLVTNFSETIHKSSGFIATLSTSIISIVAAGLLFITCFKLAPFETLIGITVVFCLFVPVNFLSRNASELGKKSAIEIQSVSSTLVSSFKNYFFLRLSNMVNSAQAQMDSHLTEYATINNKYASLSALKSALPYFIGTVVVSGVTLLSFKYFNTQPIVLLNFFFLFTRAGTNLSDINSSIVGLKFHQTYVEKLVGIMKKVDSYDGTPFTIDNIQQSKAWCFESLTVNNVDFSYLKGEHIFQNLNFDLCKGEILLIKGESGVGKSTLVSLILGLNKPNYGSIKLNGNEDPLFLNKISSVVGYVGPEPYLITGTVKENLTYGLTPVQISSISDEDMWLALEAAQIKGLVLSFSNKLNEILNEHVQISTGQKQRLSIARAFLRKPQILVFDEATANLDKVTEQKIVQELLKLSKLGTAIVLISHKETFESIADKKILMEKGAQPLLFANNSKQNIQVH